MSAGGQLELVEMRTAPAVVVAGLLAEPDAVDGRRCGAPGCDHVAAFVLLLAVVQGPTSVTTIPLEEAPGLPFCWTHWQELRLPNLWADNS